MNRNGRRALRHALQGFADGALATLPMSGFMLAAKHLGGAGRQPPERIADAAAAVAGAPDAPSELKKTAAALLHFGFGGAAGALFSAWERRRGDVGSGRERWLRAWRRERRSRTRGRGALTGAAFGSALWAASYMGWVPALGILPPAQRDRPRRQASLVVSHWIYGAVLGWRTAARAA